MKATILRVYSEEDYLALLKELNATCSMLTDKYFIFKNAADEISKLTDVNCDEAPAIASRALRDDKTRSGRL